MRVMEAEHQHLVENTYTILDDEQSKNREVVETNFISYTKDRKENFVNVKYEQKIWKYNVGDFMTIYDKIKTISTNTDMSIPCKQNKNVILYTICLPMLFALVVLLCVYLNSCKHETSNLLFKSNEIMNTNFGRVDLKIADDIERNVFNISGENNDVFSDYVRPLKIHNFSLNFDDLLYESKRNKNNKIKDYFPAYSVTGNFRSKFNQIWDPHPEYKLIVFGHHLHLILRQDNSFIAPSTFRVIQFLNNKTKIREDEDHYLGCYYKGHVQGDDQSTVAVSLCNGMTGHIKTHFGSFLIQPVGNPTTDNNVLHKVWTHSKRHDKFILPESLNVNINYGNEKMFSRLIRKKRNYVDKHLFTMEVLVAVDKTMKEFHKADLKSYILTLMSIVSNIFADASIGNSINISVPKIILLSDDIIPPGGGKNNTASQLLKRFCALLKKKGVHHDTAIMLTRDQICRNERETKCDTLGLAELGTVCKRYSCSIVQDNGLPAAFTIAHELGHILNMPHDDDTSCGNFKPYGKNTLHIMSSTMGDNIHPWSWSDCSRHYVSEFLEKEDTTCLEHTPYKTLSNDNEKLPGELYSLDQQCKLIHGDYSKYCYIEGECTRLWCKAEKSLSDCRSSNLPWADGTPCKNDTFWCQKGDCVPRNGIKHQAINGGWGPWSSFTPCSMTCGGGVQESQRECNKPTPKGGGKYCSGSRKKYRSCNTQSCPPGSIDSREQQCYDMNGNIIGIKGVNSSVKWIPKYGLTGKDRCKLYCRLDETSAYFKLAEKVKDGTSCSFDSFDKCVNGICRPAGCDNELNSIATLDKCGVCEGRNDTCEEHSGTFYRSDLSNKTNSLYYYVTTIPKGSSNILIRQPDYHIQNYLVLRDFNGKSLLNGDRVINTYRHVFFYAGVSFEYNGSNSTVEQVNTTYSRKLKSDLIVEIISLNLNNIEHDLELLSYSYTADKQNVQRKNSFEWKLGDWSLCDSPCRGISYRKAICINIRDGLEVSRPFCDSSAEPKPLSTECNMDCYLTLNETSRSECSAICGRLGERKKTYNCIQTYNNTTRFNVVSMIYCEKQFIVNYSEDCQEPCWEYTDWSPCSETCGLGQQFRRVVCYFDGSPVDNSRCNRNMLSKYDYRTRICNTGLCVQWSNYEEIENRNHHHWVVGEWEVCNNNCEKVRKVYCSLGHNKCAIEKKPIERKKCCVIKYRAMWSPCSVECGVGTRRKEFYCAKVAKPERRGSRRTEIKIDSKECSKLKVPTPKRSKKSCKISCKWEAHNWSTCSSDCKMQFQTRSVSCSTIGGKQISTKYCEPHKKPKTKKNCLNCIRQQKKVFKCQCPGYRKVRMICTDAEGKPILCPHKQKYREKCQPTEECLPKSCMDIKKTNKSATDREYTIFFKRKPVQIYCYNMNGKPREYITVNRSENYSIYYDNKSNSPDTCLLESRNSGRLSELSGIRYGRTHFNKIAINITNLRVIENDFTFSDSVGTPQPFGSAGDCSNQNKACPHGYFSINLSETNFSIKSTTRWNYFGNNVTMKMSNDFEKSSKDRRAFCGGYCGRCAISIPTGLFLEV